MIRQMDGASAGSSTNCATSDWLDDTLIVFTSDNGGERFSDNWPLVAARWTSTRAGSASRDRALARVVQRRDGQPAGCHTMDWTATLLAGPASRRAPTIRSRARTCCRCSAGLRPPRSARCSGAPRNQAAARVGNLKYLRNGNVESLFDLSVDVREQANLATLRPDDLAALRSRYTAWNAQVLPPA